MNKIEIPISYNNISDKAELIIAYPAIEFIYNNIHIFKEDSRPFYALQRIRLNLESVNCFILCNGSRIDVSPSGMSATTYRAYIHPTDRPISIGDLVNILEPTDRIDLVKTVKEQTDFINTYHKNWKDK